MADLTNSRIRKIHIPGIRGNYKLWKSAGGLKYSITLKGNNQPSRCRNHRESNQSKLGPKVEYI
jgi:hypothetical protein